MPAAILSQSCGCWLRRIENDSCIRFLAMNDRRTRRLRLVVGWLMEASVLIAVFPLIDQLMQSRFNIVHTNVALSVSVGLIVLGLVVDAKTDKR